MGHVRIHPGRRSRRRRRRWRGTLWAPGPRRPRSQRGAQAPRQRRGQRWWQRAFYGRSRREQVLMVELLVILGQHAIYDELGSHRSATRRAGRGSPRGWCLYRDRIDSSVHLYYGRGSFMTRVWGSTASSYAAVRLTRHERDARSSPLRVTGTAVVGRPIARKYLHLVVVHLFCWRRSETEAVRWRPFCRPLLVTRPVSSPLSTAHPRRPSSTPIVIRCRTFTANHKPFRHF